jgi:heat shock protein HslJ
MRGLGLQLLAVLASLALLSCTAKHKPAAATPAAPAAVAFSLAGSEWRLEDLAGSGVVDHVQATLAFPEAGKVAGNGSCNRFFGSVEVSGNALKLSPLGSTRMACPEAVMNQETKYLNALQAAERYEWKDPYLLIYCKGFDKPLRFTRLESPKASAG